MKLILFTLLSLFLISSAFADTNKSSKPQVKQKKDIYYNPPASFADVSYGSDERNILDFWQAPGEGPRPLYFYIHGGGWLGGDKSRVFRVQDYLDKGISVASINYRLTKTDILPAPVHDAARALQFVRSKAQEWNINKKKVVLAGGSAGACTAMWIACHDDLANPESADPVERESTRVSGIVVAGGQTSIDPKQAGPWIGPKVYHGMIIHAVGEENIEGVFKNYAQYEKLFKEFSPINHLTQDDPPLYLSYGDHMEVPASSFGSGIHHGMFGVKMKEKSQQVGHNKVFLNISKHQKAEAYSDPKAFINAILLGENK
jgi:acetyl esterase/lipase